MERGGAQISKAKSKFRELLNLLINIAGLQVFYLFIIKAKI